MALCAALSSAPLDLFQARGFLFQERLLHGGVFVSMKTGKTGRVMRKLLILTLLVFLAAGMGSVTTAADDAPRVANSEQEAIQKAVAWLHAQQLPDGGFGRGQSNASVTADLVYALALVGEDPDGPAWTTASGHTALGALETMTSPYVGTDAGQAGKVARAVAMAGGCPSAFGGVDLLRIIENAYDPATGRYHPSFLYRHTLAIEALIRAGVTVPPAALTALRQAQLADGGWFWAFDGTTSDVDTSGRVLQVLAGLAGVSDPAAYNRTADYLERLQVAAGGWNIGNPTDPPNSNSTALAVGGLRDAGFDPQAARFQKGGQGALDTLLSFQEASGAFVYIKAAGQEEARLVATADALVALADHRQAQPTCTLRPYLPILYIY
jgi:hypothetical protein